MNEVLTKPKNAKRNKPALSADEWLSLNENARIEAINQRVSVEQASRHKVNCRDYSFAVEYFPDSLNGNRSRDVKEQVTIKGYVQVSGFYADSRVKLFHTFSRNEWKVADAKKVNNCLYRLNGELWEFTITGNAWSYLTNYGGDQTRYPVDARFALKLENNQTEYWDNNGGQDYGLYLKHDWQKTPELNFKDTYQLLSPKKILLNLQSKNNLIVRNVGYHKEIQVVYSHDHWKTVERRAAGFSKMAGNHDTEFWHFDIPGLNANTRFCFSYRVNGITYWDNNFGYDYQIDVNNYNK